MHRQKGIPDSEVSIVSPMEIGGLRSAEYLALNPQGKMPVMKVHETGLNIPESETICRYLLSTYPQGPSFQPDNPKSNMICRFHDLYLTSIQGCLYKAKPPFGTFTNRAAAIAEFQRQMNIIEDMVEDDKDGGDYLCGNDISLADATLYPTMVFAKHMLPKFGVSVTEALPAKIGKWFDKVTVSDAAFRKVHDELMGALTAWDDKGRWDSIWLAGLRDEEPATLFDKIVSGDIPAAIVKEDKHLIAFKDINPAAPAHVLVIPKQRQNLSGLRKSSPEHIEILGRLLVAAGEISQDESLGFRDGARIVINDGKDAGQEVPHLHLHVLGGRDLTWPPG